MTASEAIIGPSDRGAGERQERLTYRYGILDARALNEGPGILECNAGLVGPDTLGIEVTAQELAAACGRGNVDPQHHNHRSAGEGENGNEAAIEFALRMSVPPAGTRLVTVRPDIDAIGAMAVLEVRASGGTFSGDALRRIARIASSDKFEKGRWPGRQSLRPDPEELSPSDLVAIAAEVEDHTVPLEQRVSGMKRWLLTGEEPRGRVDLWRETQIEILRKLDSGKIAVGEAAGGRIATVVSEDRAATAIGYRLAPVIIILNPRFSRHGATPHAKFTVAQFCPGYLDMAGALKELQSLEREWGGGENIIGSPQGTPSSLDMERVVTVVQKYLLNPAEHDRVQA